MSGISARLIMRNGRWELHLELERWQLNELERAGDEGASWHVSSMSITGGGSLYSHATYNLVLSKMDNTTLQSVPSDQNVSNDAKPDAE